MPTQDRLKKEIEIMRDDITKLKSNIKNLKKILLAIRTNEQKKKDSLDLEKIEKLLT